MDRSRTIHLVLAAPVDRVDPGPADLALAGRAVPAVVTVPVARAGLVHRGRVVPAVVMDLAVPVVLAVRAGLVRRGRVVPAAARVGLVVRVVPGERMGRAALVAPAVPVSLADPVEVMDRADLVSPGVRERARTDRLVPAAQGSLAGPVAPAGRVDLEDPVGLAVPVGLDGTDLEGLAGQVVRRRLRTCSTATTTGVVRSGVALAMHRTASARRTMVRRHRHRNTDSGGTVDLLPERRHPTGKAHRLRAAGTDRRPLGAGTRDGRGRRAT